MHNQTMAVEELRLRLRLKGQGLPLVALALCLLLSPASSLPVQEREQGDISRKSDNPICRECKHIISGLQDVMVKANQTYEKSFKKFLDSNICDNLGEDYAEDCKDVVNDELPAIWEQIIDDVLNPTMRCADLLLCPKSERVMTSDFKCDICSKVTKYIGEKVFEDPRVEKRVARRLEKICDDIPDINDITKAKCKEMVAADTPQAMKQIGEEISDDLCTDANLCP